MIIRRRRKGALQRVAELPRRRLRLRVVGVDEDQVLVGVIASRAAVGPGDPPDAPEPDADAPRVPERIARVSSQARVR